MPINGPLPKDPSQRRARNADPFAAVILPATGPDGDTPDLPNAEKYCADTLRWYNVWRNSPQASAFGATDWERLHRLALVIEAFHKKPSAVLMAEIRQNESHLGATYADRMRLRWTIAEVEAETSGTHSGAPKSADRDRRKRLLRVIENDAQAS